MNTRFIWDAHAQQVEYHLSHGYEKKAYLFAVISAKQRQIFRILDISDSFPHLSSWAVQECHELADTALLVACAGAGLLCAHRHPWQVLLLLLLQCHTEADLLLIRQQRQLKEWERVRRRDEIDGGMGIKGGREWREKKSKQTARGTNIIKCLVLLLVLPQCHIEADFQSIQQTTETAESGERLKWGDWRGESEEGKRDSESQRAKVDGIGWSRRWQKHVVQFSDQAGLGTGRFRIIN